MKFQIPQNVSIKWNPSASFFEIEGPLGKNRIFIKTSYIYLKNISLKYTYLNTISTLIKNSIIGVTRGYLNKLKLNATGYKCQYEKSKNQLILKIGHSHNIYINLVDYPGIYVSCPSNQMILIFSTCKQKCNLFTHTIEKIRYPDPYKLNGIHREGTIYIKKSSTKETK